MIRYGGRTVNLIDRPPEGDAVIPAWINKYLPLHETPLFGAATDRLSPYSPGFVWNYSPPPDVQLNRLYVPTGAGRWAFAMLLVNKATRDALTLQVTESQGAPLMLELFDVAPTYVYSTTTPGPTTTTTAAPHPGSVVQYPMHMLPGRPLFGSNDPTAIPADGCYLIPLVDCRYYWQHMRMGDIAELIDPPGEDNEPAEFNSEIIEYFRGYAGANLRFEEDAVNEYLPLLPWRDIMSSNASVAVVLDSIAAALQMVWVPTVNSYEFDDHEAPDSPRIPDATCRMELHDPNHSHAVYFGNRGGNLKRGVWTTSVGVQTDTIVEPLPITGGSLPGTGAIRPDVVQVEFPDGEVIEPNSGFASVANTVERLFALGADSDEFTRDHTAPLLASRYRAWFSNAYDWTYARFPTWQLSGYDDWVLYDIERGFTRVASRPMNFAVRRLQDDAPLRVALLSSITAGTQSPVDALRLTFRNDPWVMVSFVPADTLTGDVTIEFNQTSITIDVDSDDVTIQAAIGEAVGGSPDVEVYIAGRRWWFRVVGTAMTDVSATVGTFNGAVWARTDRWIPDGVVVSVRAALPYDDPTADADNISEWPTYESGDCFEVNRDNSVGDWIISAGAASGTGAGVASPDTNPCDCTDCCEFDPVQYTIQYGFVECCPTTAPPTTTNAPTTTASPP